MHTCQRIGVDMANIHSGLIVFTNQDGGEKFFECWSSQQMKTNSTCGITKAKNLSMNLTHYKLTFISMFCYSQL